MLQLLADNTFLLIFLVITLGAVVGAIPVAGIRFGAAGTLFVGLAVGALIPEPVGDLAALQSLGLGLFVYLVGLEAGESFFKELKSQFGVIASAMGAIIAGAAAAVVGGLLLGVSREITVGIFSGALTNTPSLSLAHADRFRAARRGLLAGLPHRRGGGDPGADAADEPQVEGAQGLAGRGRCRARRPGHPGGAHHERR
ncbi:hypothetical protein [Luteococcus sp. OSA5]|uniref:aspartate-alanine antiporter-like transporter n=1 Tax=Luteococcus sp. OSA5 TaxID=3401630 RepID=UPI003B429FE9